MMQSKPCEVEKTIGLCGNENQAGWMLTLIGYIPVCEDCWRFYAAAFPDTVPPEEQT